MPMKPLLALSYAADKRLGVGHYMYESIGNTVFSLEIQHNHIAINFVLHILRQHPGLTAIEKNGHTGGVE